MGGSATYIALLRAVNLAGRSVVSMAALRDLAAGLGLANPRSVLQSGNLLFEHDGPAGEALEARLERAIGEGLGVRTSVLVRSAPEWRRVVSANPFPAEAAATPGKLLVICLKAPPSRARVAALDAALRGPERVRVIGRAAYLVYPEGIGRSRLTTAVIERHLGTTGTARNWNTVLRLAAMAHA